MKKTLKLLAVVLGICMITTVSGYAEEGCDFHGKGVQAKHEKCDKVLEGLKLTPEQKKGLEENRQAQRKEISALHQSLTEKRANLQELLKNPATTRAQVDPVIAEIKSLQAKMTDRRIDGIFAVKSILTPEQFTKFQEKMEQKKGHRKERGQKRRGMWLGSKDKE